MEGGRFVSKNERLEKPHYGMVTNRAPVYGKKIPKTAALMPTPSHLFVTLLPARAGYTAANAVPARFDAPSRTSGRVVKTTLDRPLELR
jgi:hypothetical protein